MRGSWQRRGMMFFLKCFFPNVIPLWSDYCFVSTATVWSLWYFLNGKKVKLSRMYCDRKKNKKKKRNRVFFPVKKQTATHIAQQVSTTAFVIEKWSQSKNKQCQVVFGFGICLQRIAVLKIHTRHCIVFVVSLVKASNQQSFWWAIEGSFHLWHYRHELGSPNNVEHLNGRWQRNAAV